MNFDNIFNTAQQYGLQTDTQNNTVSGTVKKVALRATLKENQVFIEMSVNIPQENLLALKEELQKQYQNVEVKHHNFGILITISNIELTDGEYFIDVLKTCADKAVKVVSVSHDNKHESYREPAYVYFRGALGALLGALVGVIPWILVSRIGWVSMWLGTFIGIASFYGYRLFKGAHSTSFATTVIIVFSTVALLIGIFNNEVFYFIRMAVEVGASEAFKTIILVLKETSLADILLDSGLGLLFGFAGLFAIRGQISEYTHEPRFLRRDKDNKNK